MIGVNLIDEAGILSKTDFKRLKNFVIEKCMATAEELKYLSSVRVRNDGNTGYSGYWSGRYRRKEADTVFVEAVIVLNSYYLKTVEQMERTLAHEYGHHWTFFYLLDRHELLSVSKERAPWLYYRARGLDPAAYASDYSKGWSFSDKEVLAEDYKHMFSPYCDGHRMSNQVGYPSTEVKEYLRFLGQPAWL